MKNIFILVSLFFSLAIPSYGGGDHKFLKSYAEIKAGINALSQQSERLNQQAAQNQEELTIRKYQQIARLLNALESTVREFEEAGEPANARFFLQKMRASVRESLENNEVLFSTHRHATLHSIARKSVYLQAAIAPSISTRSAIALNIGVMVSYLLAQSIENRTCTRSFTAINNLRLAIENALVELNGQLTEEEIAQEVVVMRVLDAKKFLEMFIDTNIPDSEIKKASRRVMADLHPDKNAHPLAQKAFMKFNNFYADFLNLE